MTNIYSAQECYPTAARPCLKKKKSKKSRNTWLSVRVQPAGLKALGSFTRGEELLQVQRPGWN